MKSERFQGIKILILKLKKKYLFGNHEKELRDDFDRFPFRD